MIDNIKEKNYISKTGYLKLQKELEQLLKIDRPEITKIIAWAASNGDRSENADYIYGKRRLREIDKRIRFLQHRLNLAIIVDIQHNLENNNFLSEKIQFGATVTVIDEDEVVKSYTIVGVDEVEIGSNKISWRSPLGKALLGKSVNDTISFKSPNGEKTLEIIALKY